MPGNERGSSPATSTGLIRYDTMVRAIAEAHAVDEVKDIRDKALAIEHYARQAMNTGAETQARHIRLRAERRVGQMLREMEKAKGSAGQGRPRKGGRPIRPPKDEQTLSDLGISKDQSSRWQRLAELEEEKFEAALADDDKPASTASLVREASAQDESARTVTEAERRLANQALWTWGRVKEFDERGILDADPAELVAQMDAPMRRTVAQFTAPLIKWLKKLTAEVSG